MEIFNFTGHIVRYFGPDGEVVFHPDSDVRLSYNMKRSESLHKDGKEININNKMFIKDCLPEEKEGIYYIVATIVATAFPERNDLISPSDSIRDKFTGEVIGCSSFSKIKRG